MSRGLIVGLLCIFGCMQTGRADELIFKNGDKLTGKVKQLVEGKVVFESEVAGTITVDLANIQTFRTDVAVEVHLADGTVFKRIIVGAEPGFFAFKGDETLKGQEFALERIASINPPVKSVAWTGDVSAGFTSSRGNTVTDTRNISVNMMRRTEKDRSTFSGYYIEGKQEDPTTGQEITTEDTWQIKGKYDYFFTKKVYGYGNGRYEKDAIADLDRRVILGCGCGYQWVESASMNFSTEVGLASLYEKFDNQTDSSTVISAQLGYHFDKKLNDKIKFINDLTYYPSLEEFSDYFLSSTVEIRALITENMFTNFKVIFDYDVTPAQGADQTDVKYIFGAGLNF